MILEILSHEHCWFHCYSDKHSPNDTTFFSIFCNVRNSLLSFSHPIIHPIHEWSWILQTIPMQFHRFPWRNFEVLPLLEKWYYQVALIYHQVFLSSLGITRFRQEEFLRDQVELFVPFSQKFYRVALIDRTSWTQFSTLEKTKHGRHPILNNLLKRSFPWIAHGSGDQRIQINLYLHQVALIYLLQQLVSMDLDFHNFFTGLTEVEDDTNDGVLAVKCIISLNFAVTRSSPESCCDRFAIVSEQTVELKWWI